MKYNFKCGDLVKFSEYSYPEDDKIYLVLRISKNYELIELFDLEENKVETYMGSWIGKYIEIVNFS